MASSGDVLVVGGIEINPEARLEAALRQWIDQWASKGIGAVLISSLSIGGVAVDVPVILGALATPSPIIDVGVAQRLGSGRSASVLTREITTLDHLFEGRTAFAVLGSTPEHRHEAEAVVVGLLGADGEVTAGGAIEHVTGAPNRPGPRTKGGPTFFVIDEEAPSCRRHQPGSSPSVDLIDVIVVPPGKIDVIPPRSGESTRLLLATEPYGPIS